MFKLDLNDILLHAINAYTDVYGDEYADIIASKINKSIIFQYIDVSGYEDYLEYVKRCKRRELSYEFLIKARLITDKYDNFSTQFNDDIKNILDCFIGNEHTVFDKRLSYYFAPIFSFDTDNPIDSDKLIENRLKIINYMTHNQLQITRKNLDNFSKSSEYSTIIKRINIYKSIYKKLLKKYIEFENELEPYKKLITKEKESFNEIMYGKKIELFNQIFPLIDDNIILKLKEKNLTTQEDIIVGNRDLSEKTPIEYFSTEDFNILKSNNSSIDDKYWIIFFQSMYLKNFGIIFDDEILLCDNNENINKYLEFITSDEIVSLIPSQELISIINNFRNVKHNEGIKEYHTQRDDFVYNFNFFVNNEYNKRFLLNQILNNEICVLSCGGRNTNSEFISLMFFTIKKNHGGKLLHCFMHELGHIIDQNELGCGFESFNHLYNHNEKNSFDNSYRKYERFNEILTDIFTLEAVELLHNKDIYPIESKSIISDDINNFNTSSYLKFLLAPLVEKYKYYICKSKINSDPNYLIEAIGLHNFESLVKSINKIDFMLRNGLFSSDKDIFLAEYYSEIDIIEKIYLDIDIYYNSVKHLLKKTYN